MITENREKTKVCGHTIFKPCAGSKVLDVGCRKFGFSNPLAALGCQVVALDPDDAVSLPVPKPKNISYLRFALVDREAQRLQKLIKWSYGEGNHLESIKGEVPPDHTKQVVQCRTIEEISEYCKIDFWDIVKLDCEGAEYQVLLDWPGPIANQITVEFHEHTGANSKGVKMYEDIIEHLSQWYRTEQHERTVINNIANYWDSLFVLKNEH